MVELTELPVELLCQILTYLPVKTLLRVSLLNRVLTKAVALHLHQCQKLKLCLYGEKLPASLTDEHLVALFNRCPRLETLTGLRPTAIIARRTRGMRPALTVPGVIAALEQCPNLRWVETDNLSLLEALLKQMPQIQVVGHFFNSEGSIPPQKHHRLLLPTNPNITCLNLTGVEIPELVPMPRIQQLDLNYVRFLKPQPFQNFSCPNLRIFTIRHCEGPEIGLKYLPLMVALCTALNLFRLELNDIPLMGGLIQRTVEHKWPVRGFSNLKSLTIASCKKLLDMDVGHFFSASFKSMESLNLEARLCKDSLFHALKFAQIQMMALKSLHLGYIDPLQGLKELDYSDGPVPISDHGLHIVGKLCPELRNLWLQDCPHLMEPKPQTFQQLTDLYLTHCLCLQPAALETLVDGLPNLKTLAINRMFYQKPQGATATTQRLISQSQDRRSICIHFGNRENQHLGLKISLPNLVSLTLIGCGLEELVIENCTQLMHLELENMVNLQCLQVISTTTLSRINITHCPKLENSTLLEAFLNAPARRTRFVYVKPSPEQITQIRQLETELFDHKLAANHDLCLFQEISFVPVPQSPCRENLLVWLRLSNRLVTVYCKKMELSKRQPPSPRFIREKDIKVINGPLPHGSYKVKTNSPWLHCLWNVDNAPDSTWIEMPGVESFSPQQYTECLEQVEAPMAERYPELHTSQVGVFLLLPALGEIHSPP